MRGRGLQRAAACLEGGGRRQRQAAVPISWSGVAVVAEGHRPLTLAAWWHIGVGRRLAGEQVPMGLRQQQGRGQGRTDGKQAAGSAAGGQGLQLGGRWRPARPFCRRMTHTYTKSRYMV